MLLNVYMYILGIWVECSIDLLGPFDIRGHLILKFLFVFLSRCLIYRRNWSDEIAYNYWVHVNLGL